MDQRVEPSELATNLSERLSAIGDVIVSEWVDWVRSRVKNPTVDALPY